MTDDTPLDPFLGDFSDPAAALDDEPVTPLDAGERDDVLADLADLEVFQTLLEPTGIKGIVVDCEGCGETHYFSWAIMRTNLRMLLEIGRGGTHEPPFDPNPEHYVSWHYARGYADGVTASAEREAAEEAEDQAG